MMTHPANGGADGSVSQSFDITGARALIEGRFEETVVRVEAGRIAEISGSEGAGNRARLDGRGLLLLPGIVDIHGDAFERSLMPRPGVRFPPALAIDEADRLMAGFGITTAMHGVTYSWEPGLRGRDTFLALAGTLRARRRRLRCDTHMHLRFEVQNHDGLEDVARLIADGSIGVVAFNNHLADTRRDLEIPEKLARQAGRTGLSVEAFRKLVDRIAKSDAETDATIDALSRMANAAGVPLLSHDDPDRETRARYRKLGACTAEFPLSGEVAADARAHGEHVVMGGPNVLRGGSHKFGNPSAADLVADELCSVLSSDYYYPAPLHAAFRLADDGILPLERAWDLVSANPANALRMTDRGRIETGRRADLLLVDPGPDREHFPDVVATFVDGRQVFRSDVRLS